MYKVSVISITVISVNVELCSSSVGTGDESLIKTDINCWFRIYV